MVKLEEIIKNLHDAEWVRNNVIPEFDPDQFKIQTYNSIFKEENHKTIKSVNSNVPIK